MRRGGNAAFDPAILALDRQAEAQAQGRLDFDRRTTPGNTQRLADDALRVRQAQEATQQSEDTKNDYRPTSAFSRQMANDRTAFQVALEAPYIRGGAESDPLTRGNAVIKDIRQDMAQNEASRLRGQRDGTWTDDNETGVLPAQERRRLAACLDEARKAVRTVQCHPEHDHRRRGYGQLGPELLLRRPDGSVCAERTGRLARTPERPARRQCPRLAAGQPAGRFRAARSGNFRHFRQQSGQPDDGDHEPGARLNTQQLAALLTQLVQSNQELVRLVGSGQKLPGQGGPPLNGGSRTIQDNRQNANTNRPSLR